MITQEQMIQLIETKGHVHTDDGDDLGAVEQIFIDDSTGRPTWILVAAGTPGSAAVLVPAPGATVDSRTVRVPYSRDLIEGSPRMPEDGRFGPDEEQQLLRHYGHGVPAHAGTDDSHDAVPGTDTVLTRSEEQLRVGTVTRETGTIRVSKYIVTETVTETFPVRREELRVEHLPMEDAGEATPPDSGVTRIGTPFDEGEYEIVLYEERPVVELEIVAVERITLIRETITEAEEVSGEVRKEVLEATEGH
ncbi:PRC and DUF2382 domain-containing protein [Arthrobacter sp. Br18]|uniref:DUF2382 domain-containing protein n=1 Tax=Arthrobacter sp. Br18 TaxID=1312954 RepID=UPI00047D28E9|nr:PRC and DUF2382 domain-containing protein [Arthrobacter sp. Br18]